VAGRGRRAWWGIAIALVAGAGVAAQQQAQPERPWTTITEERLLKPEPGDWLSYRRTYDVMAFSPLKQIDRTNVRQLRQVWSFSMRDFRRWLVTPIVANGLMYVPEGSGRLYAFDAVTGDVVWIHERAFPDDVAISEAYARSRGVAISGDTIFWGTADSYLLALDARTGEKRWETKTGDYTNGEGHAHPPLIAEGIVFLGQAGGDLGAPGRFRAFDEKTGKLLWTINTAPGPGDPGYETWTKRDIPPLGAAPWNTISYDPVLHLVFFATGQPGPWSTALRGPGDALFTNTVLAVEAKTGKIRWYYQMNPADDWDRAPYESMLVDLTIDGKPRKAVVITGKVGWGVVLDRETGKFIKPFKTAYDNLITGWSPEGRPIVDPTKIPQPSDVDSGKVFEICPHLHGARNLQAPSFSPITKLYYLGVNNTCMDSTVVSTPYVRGRAYAGVTFVTKKAPGYDYVGEFVAFDPAKGERKWAYKSPTGAAMVASAMATAGGVVFGGTADRQFFALNTDTGELLWQTKLSGDVSGAPISFQVGGQQYIAITSGGRSGPTTSFGPLTNFYLPAGTGSISIFALPPAKEPQVSAVAPTRPVHMSRSGDPAGGRNLAGAIFDSTDLFVKTQADDAKRQKSPLNGTFTAAQAGRGAEVFQRQCGSCHGPDEHAGPAFQAKWGGLTVADMYKTISTTMPQGNAGKLSAEEYASIVAYYLRTSGFAAGDKTLTNDTAALAALKIDK